MDQNEIVEKTADFVRKECEGAESGHDWFHINRVWNNAKNIAKKEKANMLIVELGALLHDIADFKFHKGDETIGPRKAREFLESLKVPEEIISHTEKIVDNVSFKGEAHEQEFRSPELDIVQDADRLDAMGAIGIARAFGYGGFKGRAIHNPEIPPKKNMTKEEYKKGSASSINHFYEKLLLIKNRMNTKTGKVMAEERHKFMQTYLDQFYKEWEGLS